MPPALTAPAWIAGVSHLGQACCGHVAASTLVSLGSCSLDSRKHPEQCAFLEVLWNVDQPTELGIGSAPQSAWGFLSPPKGEEVSLRP